MICRTEYCPVGILETAHETSALNLEMKLLIIGGDLLTSGYIRSPEIFNKVKKNNGMHQE